MIITAEYLANVFNGKFRRPDYAEAVAESERMEQINTREGAMSLIRERNNNEPENIYKHRMANLRMITYAGFDQIFNVLSIIGHSKDFTISYPEVPARFTNESPEKYFNNLPEYGSLRNWLFDCVMRDMMFEPNGGILTTYEPKTDGYNEPTFESYEADDVLDYIEGELVVLELDEDDNGKDIYLVVDKTGYYTYTYNKDTENYYKSKEVIHNIGELPFVLFGGFPKELSDECLYRSFLSGVAEYWAEALSLNSDLQAVFKNTAFPVKMVVTDDECIGCSETERAEFNAKKANAHSNYMPFQYVTTTKSPYITHTVKPARNGEQNPIFPFVGFASPDSAIISLLDNKVKSLIADGFAAVCMQHLADVGANQSGLAKEYDRSQLNSFLYTIARHLNENILRPCVKFAINIRYGVALQFNTEALRALLPVITIPTRFDTLTASLIEQQIAQSKTSGIDNGTVARLQIDFIRKQYENEPDVAKRLISQIELDPYYNIPTADLIDMQLINTVSELGLIIHNNIKPFVMRAYEEYLDFNRLSYTQQTAILLGYAAQFKAENTPQIMQIGAQNLQFPSNTTA